MKEEGRTGRQRKEKCTGGTARGKAQALQSYVRHCVCTLSVLASDPWQRKADCFDRSTDMRSSALLPESLESPWLPDVQ